MGIIKASSTNYYELDWDCPADDVNKVYMAIKGKIEKNTILPIMSNGVGYEWKEDKKSKIKSISEQEFLIKATTKNIVYFYSEDKSNYLLNYPKHLQKVIDMEILTMGRKPHKILSIKQRLQLLQAKNRNRMTHHLLNSCKIEKDR